MYTNPTITDVWKAFLHQARHIKRGSQRGTTQVTVTTDQYSQLLTVLAEANDKAKPLAGGLDQLSKTADTYREAAKREHQIEGECEIDPGAMVSQSDDGGAYVQAWVWVSDEEAGVSRE